MNENQQPFVSVIIPVYNDADRLYTCLQALENQTYPKNLYEVIVVDNSSEQPIEPVVNQFSQAVASFESCHGSYAARNKGISLARGEVISFTDSDCVPTPEWIEHGVARLLGVPNCGLVAGKIELFYKDPHRLSTAELFEKLTAFYQDLYVREKRFGATANVFTNKKVLEDVGGFNSTMQSGGDQEWGRRVFAAGYQQIYADDVCVGHPARSSMKEIYKKALRIESGLNKLQGKSSLLMPFSYLIDPLLSPFILDYEARGIIRLSQKIRVYFAMVWVTYVRAVFAMLFNLGWKAKLR